MVDGKADQLARYLKPRAYEEVGMDARVSALLSALAATLPEAEMNPIWYAEGRRPENVLKELSISPESMLSHDDDGVLKDQKTFDKLAQWLLYEYMTYGDAAHKSAVEDLTKLERTDQEAFYLVTRIELPEGVTADGLHKWFYMKYVGVRYEMSQFWLASGKTPTDAMSLMATRCHGRLSDRYRLSYVDLADEDKEWYTFCDEFKDRSIIFSSDDRTVEQRKEWTKAITASPEKDEEVANLKKETVDLLMKDKAVDMMMKMYPLSRMSKEDALRQLLENEALAMKVWHRALADIVKKLPSDDAAFFLESLRGIPRYESGAVTMQQHLLNGASEEREKAAFQQREQAIFDLWLESDVKPESVYDIMPFALEKQYDLAVELPKGTFHDRDTNFKQLLKFISQFRRKSKFDDKEVARMLEEKGWTPEELDGLSRGIEEDPEWKNLADLLAKPVEANR